MTIDKGGPAELGHREALELLPWYVNHSLATEESTRVRRHLESCADCRGEIAELEGLAVLFRTPEDLPQARESSLATLRERIAADRSSSSLTGRMRRLRAGFRAAPKGWRMAMLAPSAVAAGLAALLFFGAPRGPIPRDLATASPDATETSFTVLADPAVEAVRYWVAFEKAATLDEVGELLLGIGATISAGPTTQGVYTVEIRSVTGTGSSLTPLAALQRSDLVTTTFEAPPIQGTAGDVPEDPRGE